MTDVTYRAERAHAILEDDLVKEAFETIEKELIQLWAMSPEADSAGRERAYRTMWCLRRFRQFFDGLIADGQIHQHQLQQLQRGQG